MEDAHIIPLFIKPFIKLIEASSLFIYSGNARFFGVFCARDTMKMRTILLSR